MVALSVISCGSRKCWPMALFPITLWKEWIKPKMYFWPTLYVSSYGAIAVSSQKTAKQKERKKPKKKPKTNIQPNQCRKEKRNFSILSHAALHAFREAAQVLGDLPLLPKSSGLWDSLSRVSPCPEGVPNALLSPAKGFSGLFPPLRAIVN